MEDINISFQLKSINDKIRRMGDATFAQYGLTGPQVAYLRCIQKSGGSLSQKELEKTFRVSHPTVVGIVSRLRDRGYIEIRTDEKDRRNRIITLTEKAVKVNDSLQQDYDEMSTNILTGLTPEEKRELSRLLKRVDDNVDVRRSKIERQKDES